ncbi:hypothetical protein [Microcoleus sp. PH2017_08_TRC_O_A]|uniref:hypothetical protein n=1 Tax=Microcoleus sp. PH2017_08_TRC_O_A TaxID=2798819 RepID=UPI001D960E4E|nr:hypothetical protein [Microcoleus sp. PH2017_08_TRC_O_A]MCC3457989.1 hypothetical protein [Microcoleus sp. PH2017_08_TRC_O_A]
MQETKENSLFTELTSEEKLWSSAPLGCVPPQLRRFLQKSSSLRLLVKFSAVNRAIALITKP